MTQNDAATSRQIDTKLARENLASFPCLPEQKPLVDILRRQLSNYERGDAESRAALKPMILASVGKIEARMSA